MKTANLTGAPLDYWTARAEGVPADQLEIRAAGTLCIHTAPAIPGWMTRPQRPLDYSTNWALAGPLVEDREIALHYVQPSEDYGPTWMANYETYGDTALIAICRAVVRAAFGDEVGDLPCA